MSAVEVLWETPPAIKTGRWEKALSPLRTRRNQWAVVETWPREYARYARAAARDLKANNVRKPPGRWEFATRTDGEVTKLYARYLGPS